MTEDGGLAMKTENRKNEEKMKIGELRIIELILHLIFLTMMTWLTNSRVFFN